MGWTYGADSIEVPNISDIEIVDIGSTELWLLSLLFFGIGDLATTGIGVSISGVSEGNPFVASTVLESGLVALGALKLVTFVTFLIVWRLVPRPERIGIPLALSVVGISVTLWNVHVLVITTGWGIGFM